MKHNIPVKLRTDMEMEGVEDKADSLYFKMVKVYSTDCMGLLISFYFIKNVSYTIINLFLI